MVDGSPSPERFEEVVGGLLRTIEERFPGRQIRAFGEMVDLLCQRGQPEAAATLEELWNDLGGRRNFSLLCGYRLDVFDRDSQVSALPHVCGAHSHILPAEDPVRLRRAVDSALEEVLGPEQTGRVYSLAASTDPGERVPLAQMALMWVSAEMPALAERVLASARSHYLAAPASNAA